MNEITLQRKIIVQCWRVQGTIAKSTNRAVLLSVLQRVKEQSVTDANDVAKHLLFDSNSRIIVAKRLLEIGRVYKLLEENRGKYNITEDGEKALETQEVFIPEEGNWTIWFSEDPLLPNPILKYRVWEEPTAYDEIINSGNSKQRRMNRLPSILKQQEKRPQPALAVRDDIVRIEDLKEYGELVDTQSSLTLIWRVTNNSLALKGTLEGIQIEDSYMKTPNVSLNDIWEHLLYENDLLSDWDKNNNRLLVDFDKISPTQRTTLKKDIHFSNPSYKHYGSFDSTTISDVDIMARSTIEATDWAQWRLESLIENYATEENFSKWTSQAIAPFNDFNLSLPSRVKMAEIAWSKRDKNNDKSKWYLTAAQDWRL